MALPYQTMSSEVVKYALCLMVRNVDKKLSGGPEAGKGSEGVKRYKKNFSPKNNPVKGSEEVKRCKKLFSKELPCKRGQKDRVLVLLDI